MEKANIYRKGKKILNFYMAIVLVITLLLARQLMISFEGKNIKYIFEDSYKKVPVEIFVKAIFSLSPNMKYISETTTDETIKEVNKYSIFTKHYIPVLTYLMNSQIITTDSMVEIYPYLKEHTGENYASDEKFRIKDLYDKNDDSIEVISYTLEQLKDFNFMLNKLYIVDKYISVEKSYFDVKYFMEKDLSLDLKKEGPKILIYHTHSQEAFVDSKKGEKSDTIVGAGDELVRILQDEYNIEVIHLREEYDIKDGKEDRTFAYERIEPTLKEIIKKNPSIEILIDLHRDGIPNDVRLVTTINGKPTAKIMFFNGLCKIMKNGKMVDIASMPNPYIKDNMAFSFQMNAKANLLYPGLSRKIYLKGYRYNLHLKPKSLLVEVGAQTNTVEEIKNAMEPLAKILYEVIR